MVIVNAGSVGTSNNNNDDNTSLFHKLTNKIKGWGTLASDTIKEVSNKVVETSKNNIETAKNKVISVKDKTVEVAKSATNGIKKIFSSIPNLLKFGVVGLVSYAVIKVV